MLHAQLKLNSETKWDQNIRTRNIWPCNRSNVLTAKIDQHWFFHTCTVCKFWELHAQKKICCVCMCLHVWTPSKLSPALKTVYLIKKKEKNVDYRKKRQKNVCPCTEIPWKSSRKLNQPRSDFNYPRSDWEQYNMKKINHHIGLSSDKESRESEIKFNNLRQLTLLGRQFWVIKPRP